MLLELLLALIIGCLAGSFTGITPGIHINLVAAFLLATIDKLPFSPISLSVFIVAMSITHTFIDFIPSIFLGAPEEDTFLSILPGHELFREGKGHQAIIITLFGCLFAIPLIFIATPLFINFLPSLYEASTKLIPFSLIFISFYLIFREENIILGIVSFILAGILGISVFNIPIKDPLLPLLSGLFGTSSLIISLTSTHSPKKQHLSTIKQSLLTKKEFIKASIASSITPLFSFLPGIGSGHAALFGSELVPQERKGFLFLTGAASTTVMGLSFITLYAIAKTRSGTAAAVQQILQNISLNNLIIILTAILLSAIIAFTIGFNLSKVFAKHIGQVSYKKLTLAIIALILIINFLFTGIIGLLVLITSTALGIFIIQSGSRRINMMGSLILPAVSYYLLNG